MKHPLVTVICLSHNHKDYVVESLESIRRQTYPNIQWVVVDDASTDGTDNIINDYLSHQKINDITFLPLKQNIGNCRAFNQGFAHARGEYIIDLAADDVMLPERIALQVELFSTLPETYGVVYSDCWLTNQSGQRIATYYKRDERHRLYNLPPSGNIFAELLGPAFISSPSMMIKKRVLDNISGYDEHLSYEDFDFWIRSGKHYAYAFQNEILTEKRVLDSGHHRGFYKVGHNPHLASTLVVCHKAVKLLENPRELSFLGKTLRYHYRLAFFTENFKLAGSFYKLLLELGQSHWLDRLLYPLNQMNLSLNKLYQFYQRNRRGVGSVL